MDLKEAINVCRRPTAKAFIVAQDTNELLTKDSKASKIVEVDNKLGYNDNILYDNYLDTTSLLHKKDAVE